MKPFRFPLESLRMLRKQKESIAQQCYANALISCGRAETRLQVAVAELTAGWDSLNHDLTHGVVADKITGTRTWWMVLEIRRKECKAALDAAHGVAGMAFQKMLTAIRDRETLDRFYNKSRRAHDRDAQRAEQKDFDEMAVQSNGVTSLLQPAGHNN
jgi:flagellar export protein FliJ